MIWEGTMRKRKILETRKYDNEYIAEGGGCLYAVSYTHLDVYKRQDIGRIADRVRPETGIVLRKNHRIAQTEVLRARGVPVSYTHLDVYKRQALSG